MFITAVGIDPAEAADGIRKMHRLFRRGSVIARDLRSE